MSNILLVPVHLDALLLDHDQMVVEATADFSRLPFVAGKRDINPDIANVSEEIVSTPFQNENLLLKKGIHLHWSLPDALTRARYNPKSPEKQDFPRVPNRWVVTRCNEQGAVEKEWLIESDFLHPAADGNPAGTGVTIPYRKDKSQPFRYMGRTMELFPQRQDQGANRGEYYPKLTAVGYGEPSFAAFYPNCYSVFGFCDTDYSGASDERRYYVMGWYSNPDEDVLMTHVRDALLFRPNDFTKLGQLAGKLRDRKDALTQYLHGQFSADTKTQLQQYTGPGDPPEALRSLLLDDLNRQLKTGRLYDQARFAGIKLTPETVALVARTLETHEDLPRNRVLLEEAFPEEIARRSLPQVLKDSFKWTFTRPNENAFPFRMICFAQLTVGQPTAQKELDQSATVAIGNTGTEALSACLATKMYGNAPDAQEIVEDQLEALHLAPALESRQLDVPAKFVEGRHEKGFAAVPGGTIWTVRADDSVDSPAKADDTPSGITLPDKLGQLLNTVNERQAEYDRASHQIESLRIQLFSDWYKYMLCAYPPQGARDAYPDVDEVQSYIDFRTASLNQRIMRAGTLLLKETSEGVVAQVSGGASLDDGGRPATLAAALAKAINELQTFLTSHKETETTYRLKQASGPRYWQPTEPSVLIDGAIADPSKRHGHDGRPSDGLLPASLMYNESRDTQVGEKAFRDRLRTRINNIGGGPDRNFAYTTWNAQPWNPFLLEWDVEVFPVEHKSNIDPKTGHYAEDFITANYQLLENDVDLSLRRGRGTWTLAANVYTGRSILTPHATQQLAKQSESYIEKKVAPAFLKAKKERRLQKGSDGLVDRMKEMQDWYEKKSKALLHEANGDVDPTLTAFRAWGAMRDPDCLSQSLSGFNDALLMHKQTLQLLVSDPLGFNDYKPFADRVAHSVNDSIYSAPAPQNDFNPIRSGMMKIHRLRLVDTFGQIKDLDVRNVVTSKPLDDGTEDPLVSLPPRLTQPARVNFRWLSADSDQEEMNDHPATTPICGWVLANNLDDSLMIYDNSGKALGSLVKKDGRSARVEWVRAPGGLGVGAVKEIPNSHLQKMVQTIQQWGADFLDDFISAIDSAVENIEPENFGQHRDLALLMGRPLALVRASINLELKGLPASHQGWNEFRQDLNRDGRDDNGFSRVRFPIRIGEYNQFNDGTVGYWKENGDEYEDNAFFSPQSDDETFKTNHLKTHRTHAEEMVFFQTVEAEPQILSLLIDPRGVVHATTGIVPVKAINIPPDQYSEALQAIEITFLSAPIITDAGKIHLPLPEEAGYQWSWLQQDVQHVWSEVSSRGVVRKESFAVFGDRATDIWADLITQGWIKLLDENDETRASVVAKDRREKPELSDNVKDKRDEIEDILDRSHIGPVDSTARFSGAQEIREGWLKLSRAGQPSRNSSNR
ncbi:MAG TPA: hypothetical protein VFI24_05970 [Pyrinomonadaceae bacterium]|nr:hypothetical protein [Pyrinomonadaceae bacterium]